jgi:hypothetical protein
MHAHGIWVGRCGKPTCRSIHIDLCDEDGEVIACACIAVDDVRGFTENIKDCAYAIIAGQQEEPRQ